MTRIVLRGGTALDQTGERRVDVAIAGGRVVEVGHALDGDLILDATD